MSLKALTILGSTGSIGVSTLDVVQRHPERFKVFALTANHNSQLMLEQCLVSQPRYAVMLNEQAAEGLAKGLKAAGSTTEVLVGKSA